MIDLARPESVERFIAAPADVIFDLLASPDGHARIDGSGTVRGVRGGDRRLSLGSRFGMDMHLGAAYATRNIVTEFEEGRRIAWQVRSKPPVGLFLTGRTWRYELEPGVGGTLVRETWDPGTEVLPSRYVIALTMRDVTRRNMTRTLDRIAELVEG